MLSSLLLFRAEEVRKDLIVVVVVVNLGVAASLCDRLQALEIEGVVVVVCRQLAAQAANAPEDRPSGILKAIVMTILPLPSS